MSPIEAMARALCRACGDDPDLPCFLGVPFMVRGGFHGQGEPVPAWMLRANEAREALAALREPSPQMVERGDFRNRSEGWTAECFDEVREIWTAMIDAALEQGL